LSWVTCHIRSHKVSNGFWVRHDNLAFTHLTCPPALKHILFKPFKTIFKKERDVVMVVNKYQELDKITLAGWVDKAID
jgi:hypothetical protein